MSKKIYIAIPNPKSTHMKFIFKEDGEPLSVRKIPHQNVIEAKTVGKILLYERTAAGPKKINDVTDPRERIIVEVIEQYYMGQKQSKVKTKD